MAISDTTTTLFLEVLSKWAHGAMQRDARETAFQINQLRACGTLLTSNPEFKFHDGGLTPDHALHGMLALLTAVADVRQGSPAKAN